MLRLMLRLKYHRPVGGMSAGQRRHQMWLGGGKHLEAFRAAVRDGPAMIACGEGPGPLADVPVPALQRPWAVLPDL